MKTIISTVLITLFILVGYGDCDAQKKKPTYFDYGFLMEGTTDSDMTFEDSVIVAKFIVLQKGIAIQVKNKLADPLRIIWDETNIVHGSNAMRVMHNGVKYSDRNNSQQPTLIPPGSMITDEIIPTDNVSFYSGGRYTSSEWFVSPLFPLHDAGDPNRKETIMAMIGHPISLFMTIQNKEERLNYNWKFFIDTISEK